MGRAGLGARGAEGRVCRPPGCGAGPRGGPQGFGRAGCRLPSPMGLVPPLSGQPSPWAQEPPTGPAPSQQHSPPVTSGNEVFDLS